MAKPNRKGVRDLGKSFKLFETLANGVYDRGGDDETLSQLEIKTTLKKVIDALMGSDNLSLKNLKFINNILVKTPSFSKDSFFGKNGPVQFHFWDNFTNKVLKNIPNEIAGFEGSLTQTQLTKGMYDREILSELGNPKPFTPEEFGAVISHLLTKQPNGENGNLLTNGYANIFYVQLEDRLVAVFVRWLSDYREWGFDAYAVDGTGWFDGRCVFSRS